MLEQFNWKKLKEFHSYTNNKVIFGAESEQVQRRSLLLFTGTCALIVFCYSIHSYFGFNNTFLAKGWLLSCLGFLSANIIFYFSKNYFFATHWYIGLGTLTIFSMSYFTGGIQSATLFWISAPPLVSSLLLGPKATITWSCISLIQVGFYIWADLTGQFVSASLLNDIQMHHNQYLTLIGMIVFYVIISFAYDFKVIYSIKRMEQFNKDVAESESRYKKLIESSFSALCFSENGRIIDCNRAWEEMYGYGPNEMIGVSVRDLGSAEDAKKVMDNIKKNYTKPYILKTYRKNGETFFIEVLGHNTMLNGQEVRVTAGRDVSQHIKAEEEKRELHSKMVASAKLASIGELAAGVGHEVNNPLGIAMGYSRAVIDLIKDREDLSEVAELIKKQQYAHERISKIVDGLRTFSLPNKEDYGPMEVKVCLQRTLSLISEIYKKEGIHIEYDMPKEDYFVSCSMGKVQQIIMNVMANARDALNHGQHKKINLSMDHDNHYVYVVVEDNGIGMDEDTAQKIYDPFYTTKDIGKGMGLGLSLSLQYAREMGGDLYCESTVGHGSKFTIKLPFEIPESMTIQ